MEYFWVEKSVQRLEKNSCRWLKDQENMVDVAKSHIPSQWPSSMSSWNHVIKHCHDTKILSFLMEHHTIKTDIIRYYCYILTFDPAQKCYSKVMHRKEVTHSNGSYVRKSRGRKLADEMGRAKKKFPWYTHRLMHRKRVTSELHDSYFRLVTIKHLISKIEWALNNYIIELSSTSQFYWVPVPVEFDTQGNRAVASRVPDSWRQNVVGKATSGRRSLWALMSWGPEKMLIRCNKESQHPAEWALGLRLSSPREQERHNVTVITVGSKYCSYVRSPTPSHMQPLNNPFEPLQ